MVFFLQRHDLSVVAVCRLLCFVSEVCGRASKWPRRHQSGLTIVSPHPAVFQPKRQSLPPPAVPVGLAKVSHQSVARGLATVYLSFLWPLSRVGRRRDHALFLAVRAVSLKSLPTIPSPSQPATQFLVAVRSASSPFVLFSAHIVKFCSPTLVLLI